MFSDLWVISGKYNDKAGLVKSPGSFDALEAAAMAVCPDDPAGFTDLGPHRLCDCFSIPDMNIAVDRILDAVDTGERIVVFGDYDCDGVCATALLYDFLKKSLECDVSWRVPERREGYGLSVPIIDELALMGVTLIITVDNGISANEEIAYCDSRGIDVIMTDHHEITKELPGSICNCDPQREDSVYPVKNICGCVVAYKLCEALSISVGIDGIENYLPLAAIATVGDIMELKGENRSIVKLGLDMIGDTMFPGLNVLVAERKEKKRSDEINAEFLSYYIVPVLNAAGRMGDAADAVRLLLAESEKEALPLLHELLKLGELRRTEVERISADFEADPGRFILNSMKDEFLFIRGAGWSEGIIGVFASKLCEKLNKSICVLTEEPAREVSSLILRASVRGSGKFNVVKALATCSDILVKFGGHENACGFSVDEKNLDELVKRLSIMVESMTLPAVNTKEALLYLPPECITLETAERIKKLEPFGEGNPQPVFVTGDIDTMETVKYGTPGKVIKFNIRFRSGGFASGVNFKDLNYSEMLASSTPTAVVYTLGINEFNGKRTAQMNVIDVIEGERSNAPLGTTYGERLDSTDIDLFKAFHMTKEDLATVYKILKGLGKSFTFRDISLIKRDMARKGGEAAALFTWFKLRYALEIFNELGLIDKEKAGSYNFPELRDKKDLSDSRVFDVIGTRYE